MSRDYMKRPGPEAAGTTHRAPTGGDAPVYLRRMYRSLYFPIPSDAEIRNTAEYRSYMDRNLVWQWELHVTGAEALAACRLILADLDAGQHVSWPGDARKYIYSVRAIAGMNAAAVPVASPQDTPAREPEPSPVPGPVPPPGHEARPPGPEPDPTPKPDPERRIVTPTVEPPKDKESFRKRLEDAERWLEDLRRHGETIADEVEKHVKRARELFDDTRTVAKAVGSVVLAGVLIVLVPGGTGTGAAVLAELAGELDELDRIRERYQPYDPRKTRGDLEKQYPDGVDSSTVPPEGGKNVKYAGQRHPESGIVFDERGFPIFDDVAVYETRLPDNVVGVQDRQVHMRAASRRLWKSIERGDVPAGRFTDEQLTAIKQGEPKIPGLTWHHHQDRGRMQLIPFDVHKSTGHVGGYNMWYGGRQ